MAENLLSEFPPTSTAEWEAAVARDLKGADYQKKLVWRTAEGMAVRPYYRAEDIASIDWLKAAPGAFPYVRGTRMDGSWRIRESIDGTDSAAANRMARSAVAAGAQEIAFGKIAIANISDLTLLFADLETVPVHLAAADERLLQRLMQHLKKAPRTALTSTGFDPLKDVERSAEIAAAAPEYLVPFFIDLARLEEGGATSAEQVGFGLAAGIEYLSEMQKRNVEAARAAALVQFSFAIGSNFFFEIAKLRAFRMLWSRVIESFKAPAEAAKVRIAARTSRWTKTIYDPHVNVLRATTEAMAAVLGGADSVSVAPFDECYNKPDEASRRLARNTQIILQREAMLARVADPVGGSYALESITDFLAREAWKRMQEVESRGGYRQGRQWIRQSLDSSLAAREKAVATRRRVFVGTNQFANPTEKALSRIDAARIPSQHRGASAYEQLRLLTERSGKTVRVLLAEIGDVKMRAARATFAANFFSCAGFEITARRFKNVDEILANDPDLIVLCSADAEYLAVVSELLPKMKAAGRATPVIVAGNPEDAEEMKSAGVTDFIHVRSNPLEALSRWQQRLGIAPAVGKD